LASSRGIIESSTLAALFPLLSSECRNATQGRTASAVLARLKGSWQRCSSRNGLGILESSFGRPISSHASRLAISKGVSSIVSALPPGNAAWPKIVQNSPVQHGRQ
jgi:hypothetical protein